MFVFAQHGESCRAACSSRMLAMEDCWQLMAIASNAVRSLWRKKIYGKQITGDKASIIEHELLR